MSLILLDHDRELRFDYDALDRLCSLPSGRRGGRTPLQLWGDANGMDLGALAILVWAANKHEDRTPGWTIEKAHAEIRRALQMRRTTFRQMNEALNEAMTGSEAIGLGTPKAEEDEAGAEGNGTSPASGVTPTVAAGPMPIGSPRSSAD